MNIKKCSSCKTFKDFVCFSKCKSYKDGYSYVCKECINTRHKKYYSANKEKILKSHREDYLLYGKDWKSTRKAYYINNKKYLLNKQKERLLNPVVKNNRNKVAAIRDKIRRLNDPKHRIKKTLRTRIWNALKGIDKSKTTEELIGCSFENLKLYLESKFKDGMSWDNYGKWHIDHIKPCDSFDLTKEYHQRECFHYTNLQPLWAADNIKKSNIVI